MAHLAESRAAPSEAALVSKAFVQFALGRPALYGFPSALPFLSLGETVYHAPTPPRALAGAAAAMLIENERALGPELDARRDTALYFRRALGGHEERLEGMATVAPLPATSPSFLRFPTTVAAKRQARLLGKEARRLGIQRSYPMALARLAAIQPLIAGRGATSFPGAERLAEELVTLPTHSRVTQADRARIVGLLAGMSGSD